MGILTTKWCFPPWSGKRVGPAPKPRPAHPNGVKRNAQAETEADGCATDGGDNS
jgi:hypothetical protein